MKRILNVTVLAFVSLTLVLSSCNEEEEQLNSIGDIYVTKKKVNDEIVYGTTYFLYSNKAITSVEVKAPGGNDITLSAYEGATLTFSNEPKENDYSEEKPTEGNYLFKVVTTNGETMEVDEVLEFDDMEFPVISETIFDSQNDSYIVEWNEVESADGYFVQLYDDEHGLIYTSPTVDYKTLEFEITTSDGLWQLVPRAGRNYSIHVHAIFYESTATFEDYVYNLKEITIAEKGVIWGE